MAQSPPDIAAAPAPTPLNLPPRPAHPPPDLDSPSSPPRKRPRTKAPPRPAPLPPSTAAPPRENLPPPSQSSERSQFTPLPQPSRFPIQPLHRFQGASASIKRPREIAHFSYDENHEYKADESGINYYCAPQIGADLKEGFDTFRHYEDETDPHLDSLLRAVREKERSEGERCEADFVTWRGMMTKIMTAPFDHFAEFSMFATLHDGTIYIEEDFPSRHADRASQASRPPPRHHNPHLPDHKMMTYWGYKFEVLSLLPTPPSETPRSVIDARRSAPVSNYAQHCSIVRTSFGPHSLILGGEVDGLEAPKPPEPDKPIPWIELKTTEELPPANHRSHHDVLKFERKLLKFWAQSFLLGVPKVIVGFRSKQGILRGVQELETGRIPGMVRRGTACWDGNVCINFATSFLGWLKETVREEGVYKVSLGKKAGAVEVVRVRDGGTGAIVSSEFLEWREMGKREEAKDEDDDKEGEASAAEI